MPRAGHFNSSSILTQHRNTDVDECNDASACGPNARCTNIVGGFECECISGYERLSEGANCTDINECMVSLIMSFHYFLVLRLNPVIQLPNVSMSQVPLIVNVLMVLWEMG